MNCGGHLEPGPARQNVTLFNVVFLRTRCLCCSPSISITRRRPFFTYKTVLGSFSGSPKSRHQDEVVQKLAEMIGTNVKLLIYTT